MLGIGVQHLVHQLELHLERPVFLQPRLEVHRPLGRGLVVELGAVRRRKAQRPRARHLHPVFGHGQVHAVGLARDKRLILQPKRHPNARPAARLAFFAHRVHALVQHAPPRAQRLSGSRGDLGVRDQQRRAERAEIALFALDIIKVDPARFLERVEFRLGEVRDFFPQLRHRLRPAQRILAGQSFHGQLFERQPLFEPFAQPLVLQPPLNQPFRALKVARQLAFLHVLGQRHAQRGQVVFSHLFLRPSQRSLGQRVSGFLIECFSLRFTCAGCAGSREYPG